MNWWGACAQRMRRYFWTKSVNYFWKVFWCVCAAVCISERCTCLERRPSAWCRSVFPQLWEESSRRSRRGLVRECGLTPWLGKPCNDFLISSSWNTILGKKRRCTLPMRELSLVLVASPLRCVLYRAGNGVGRWGWVTYTPAYKNFINTEMWFVFISFYHL